MRKIKKVLHYTAIFEAAAEGGYIVRIPTLGCVTEGDTFEEAKTMAKDAIKAFLASLLKHGEPIPEEGPVESALSARWIPDRPPIQQSCRVKAPRWPPGRRPVP